ncbi:MAG: S8 family serine peptidase, partial [Caldilineales bacterium]|nr:S8 family serine peptidase [Caldilineales bacterium]
MLLRRSLRALFLLVLLLAWLPASAASPANPSSASRTTVHKAIAPAGLLDPAQPGVTLWHDYGAFALYRITDEALASLPPAVRRQVVTDPEMDRILFDRHPLDTRSGRFDLPAVLTVKEVAGPSLHLVQFVGPIKQAWLDAVAATGATPVQYIANNAYLVWADGAARQRLDALARRGDFLQYSNPHQPGFKLGPSVERRIVEQSDPEELVPVEVQIYNHPGKAATQETIRRLAVSVQADWWPILAFENAEVTVRARDLLTIARLPDVVWLAERFPRQLYDEVQGQIVAGHFDASQSGPSGPGYLAWLDSLGFSQNPADYPIVSVSDDGIGNGSVANGAGDSTFTRLRDGVTTRLAFITNCTTDSSGDGRAGHGHINTSIVGGYDQRTGFPFRDPNGFLRGLGISPYGRMAGTKVFTNAGSYSVSGCGGNDAGVIKRQQDNGALISTNSWGCSGCAGTYDTSSQAYDAGVRDADTSEAGNQQMTFVFSAGNSGSSANTIGTPGNGKNVLTVGASENRRPSDENGSWSDGCGIGPSGADNAMDVISFSSRGPAPGGRAKPETIAPGTHVQGTASTHPSYDGTGVCDKYRPSGQTVFAASSGTSHSAPAVAGVTSLYHYWLRTTHGVADPTPALIKAYVIAHPTYLTGVGANDTLPSNSQGYGMPNLELAFDSTPRALVNQTVLFDNSGETWTWTGSVADPSKPLRIVLAYTDAPGNTGTSPQVNNLNLTAVVNGVTYLGNRFSGRWSVSGGTADNANNYEAIFLPAGTSGPVQITVTAFNIAGNGVPNVGDGTDQDFALVCYNCIATPDFTVAVTPTSQAICAPADAVYTVNLTSLNGFADPVTLSASGHPAGTTAGFSPNPVIPTGSSTLTIGNTGAAAAGNYTVNVIGTSGSLTRQTTASLSLFTAAPAAPALVSPADGSVGVAMAPTLSWSAAAQAATYQLQVATDPGFANVVINQSGL